MTNVLLKNNHRGEKHYSSRQMIIQILNEPLNDLQEKVKINFKSINQNAGSCVFAKLLISRGSFYLDEKYRHVLISLDLMAQDLITPLLVYNPSDHLSVTVSMFPDVSVYFNEYGVIITGRKDGQSYCML